MERTSFEIASLIFIFLCFFCNGCKVGPNYCSPVTVVPIHFSEDQPEKTEEIEDEDLIQWWTIFNDPFLNELLETAITHNFDYKIALEKVYQARAQYWIQVTQILPEFDADFVATRFRTSQSFANQSNLNNINSTSNLSNITPASNSTSISPLSSSTATISPTQNFFQIGLDAIWEIDLFGKFRRSAVSAYDLWEASFDEMRGVKIVVISEVANTYAAICSYQKKKDIALQIVNWDEELVDLSRKRFEAGLADNQEVETFIAALEADKAQLAIVQATLKQLIYSLAVLVGKLPEEIIDEFQIERPIPQSIGKVPISLPSELLRRRPDIQSAERQLASATEQIGVAVADLFPRLSLTGSSSSFAANPLQGANVGFASDSLSKLFRHESFIWGVGAFITAPVFDFGKRKSAIDVQIALRNQAYYTYQKTVIAALQETEQALATYFNDESRERSLENEVLSNSRILLLTQDLFQAGLADYTRVLQAKETWIISLNLLTDSQQALTSDLIAIYKALGGDW